MRQNKNNLIHKLTKMKLHYGTLCVFLPSSVRTRTTPHLFLSPFLLVGVKRVMSADLCVLLPRPITPPEGVPVPPSPPRVSPSTTPMCSAASWRSSLVTVVTADDAPSSPASCRPTWWTTRLMLDSKVWYSVLGEWGDEGEGDMGGCRVGSNNCCAFA